MAPGWQLPLLLLHLMLVQSFNMDTKDPAIIHGDVESHFGYKVLQFGSETNPGIIVSAPLRRDNMRNITGAIYKCGHRSQACDQIPIPGGPELHIEGVGLSLAMDPSSPSKLLVCAPALSYSCGHNKYVNGICYQFDSNLALSKNITPVFQDCPEAELDIAFLIDGSGSISADDFRTMKRFMRNVTDLLKGDKVQFAIAQFSDKTREEFGFSDYRKSSNPGELISRIKQMNSVTFTPSGIKFVAENIFREDQGARSRARWVMIVITDGESNDVNVKFPEAIAAAKKKNILRYAIGVGDAFSTERATEELNVIASKPSVDFVFKATNFAALENINEKLKEKIFAIEGTGDSSGKSSFKLELAQSGFSAIFSADTILLGAVGVNDWAGGLVEVRDGKEEIINVHRAEEMPNAYLGYSIVEARVRGRASSVVGAPRYNHMGRVVIFERGSERTKWEVKQHIDGEQIGSYFGAELACVDLDGDGETDVLLIGAPLYHESGIGGRVSVCTLSPQGRFSCAGTLRGDEGNGLGRFGTSIAALRDLNGDGLGDVAIGAPLEDEHRGSVYIYHGKPQGIGPRYSQRIAGSRTVPGLKYFGQSIDGKMDLTQDGLTDVVVGALGGAVILRSSPVLSTRTTVTFDPGEIPLASFGCTAAASDRSSRVDARLCFHLKKESKDALASLSANLNYTLELDAGRQKSRAVFQVKQRSSSHLVNISLGENCFPHPISILACIEDYFNPIQLTLKFCVEGNPIPGLKTLSPAFNETCVKGLTWKLPFEKNCGTDQVCIADLELAFNFSGADVLIVHPTAVLNMTVRLANVKENSYQTAVKIFHPPGLSFRKVTVLKSNRKVSVACDDTGAQGESKVTSCNINHPVFAEDTEVVFVTTLDVSNTNTWNDTLSVKVTAYSENERAETLNNNQANGVIPVQYSVNLLLTGLDSVNYVNFSLKSKERKEVVHLYRVENLGRRPLPVSITFIVPQRFASHFVWNVSRVTTDQAPTNRIDCDVRGKVRGQAGVTGAKVNKTDKDCLAEICQEMVCVVGQLVQKTPLILALRGDLILTNTSQTEPAMYLLQSVGRLHFDRTKYIQAGDFENKELFHRWNVTTDVEMFKEVNYIPWIGGGAAGGLVLLVLIGLIFYKVGFFKRNYKDLMTEKNAEKVDVGEEGCEEPLRSCPDPPLE